MPTLGHIPLNSPFLQAALSGYSDRPMRLLARRHGAAYTVHEVLIDRFIRELRSSRGERLRVTDDEHPAGGQLMGSLPDDFPPAAIRLVAAGFDVIDINFGCPVKSAIGGCRGGYHLGQPAQAIEIIRRVRDAVPPHIPVTVKMRRGIDDTTASRDRFFEILAGAYHNGVAAVTVHGRTVEQKYVGPSRWEFLKDVKQFAGGRTVIGSGDLFSAEDCLRMLRDTGVDAVSIARGAIGNPWIFRDCLALERGEPLPPPPDVHEQRAVIEEHAALIQQHQGDRGFSTLRKFAIKYARLHPDHAEVRNAFGRGRTPEEFRAILDRWYTANQPGIAPQVDEVSTAAV
ncbi:MAG: tRNA-dihydrouridine synthase [Planctomycetaceae bacterium]